MKSDELVNLAKQTAWKYDLPQDLVCAVIEQESGWNEYCQRYEPSFMAQYIGPLFTKGNMTPTEAYSRAMSWGLMQVMGETAREHGFRGDFLAELCAPINGIEYGCQILQSKMHYANGDTEKALLLYNGGSDAAYPGQVLARIKNYQTTMEAT